MGIFGHGMGPMIHIAAGCLGVARGNEQRSISSEVRAPVIVLTRASPLT
jgi:hypothetical protein